jgi:predicted RNA binding protein YcfA (HicA-like mRNA interferase family)
MRPYPKTLNQRSMKKLLEANGWVATVGGKHVVKMEKPGRRPITLPANKRRDHPPGLRAAILKEAGLLARRSHDPHGRGP